MSNKYKIIGGQILDEKGNNVPLEFGNPEQIKLLKEYESRNSELIQGLELEVDFKAVYTASTSFKCSCDKKLYKSEDADDDDDIECMNKEKITCSNCKSEYILYVQDENLFVKKL